MVPRAYRALRTARRPRIEKQVRRKVYAAFPRKKILVSPQRTLARRGRVSLSQTGFLVVLQFSPRMVLNQLPPVRFSFLFLAVTKKQTLTRVREIAQIDLI